MDRRERARGKEDIASYFCFSIFLYRILTMDRAQLGGLDDVGIGALFGLAGEWWGGREGGRDGGREKREGEGNNRCRLLFRLARSPFLDVSSHSLLLIFLSISPSPSADYRFEVMGLLMHAHHLDRTYGTGPHTISIPRMQPALNAPAAEHIPMPVGDNDFKKLVAVIRCAVPYTGKREEWRKRRRPDIVRAEDRKLIFFQDQTFTYSPPRLLLSLRFTQA